MKHHVSRQLGALGALLASVAIVAGTGGCNMATRLSEVGDYRRCRRSPIRKRSPATGRSTCRCRRRCRPGQPQLAVASGARAFFKDIRAKEVGDR